MAASLLGGLLGQWFHHHFPAPNVPNGLPDYQYAVDSPNAAYAGMDSFLTEEQKHDLFPGLATVDRRFYFPDTWLWETHHIGYVFQTAI